MSWRVTWRVRCERCKVFGPPDEASHAAERKAIKKGWRRGDCMGMAIHVCQDCVALGLPLWWPSASDFSQVRWE